MVEDYVFNSNDPAFCQQCHSEAIAGSSGL